MIEAIVLLGTIGKYPFWLIRRIGHSKGDIRIVNDAISRFFIHVHTNDYSQRKTDLDHTFWLRK